MYSVKQKSAPQGSDTMELLHFPTEKGALGPQAVLEFHRCARLMIPKFIRVH